MKLVAKWKSMPDSVKSSCAFAISSFVLKGISFITTPIFTRIMDRTQYGLITTYSSWSSILEVFAVLGLTSAGVFNSGLNEYKNERNEYIFSVLTLCNLVTCIVFGCIFLIKFFFPSIILENNLLVLMLIHFLFYPAQIFWITKQKYLYKYRLATLVTIGSAIVCQVVAMGLVLRSSTDQGTVKLWANELSGLIFCVPIYVILLCSGFNCKNLPRWKNILKFAFPLIPHYLAQHVMSGADRIMIADLVSKADAAIYGVVSNISMISVIFWNAINGSLIPYTYEKINAKDYRPLNGVIKLLLIGYGLICVVVVFIAPEVLRFLAPRDYYSGVYAVPPIAAVAFLGAVYNIYANVEFYYKKATNIAIATVVAAIVNIGLNMLLIPIFSYTGAAYTTLISSVVLLIMHYYGYKKSTEEIIYDDKVILCVSLGVILICIVCTLLYLNDIVRYVVIVLCLFGVVYKRKLLIKIFADLRGELRNEKNV